MNSLGSLTRCAILLALTAAFASAADRPKIVILHFNGSRAVFAEAQKGMFQALKDEGFDQAQMDVVIEDAKGKTDELPALVRKAQAEKPDAFVAFGTVAAAAFAKEIHSTPLVISEVFDPVQAKIAKGWTSSGNNVTGASNFVPLAEFLYRLIKRYEGSYTVKRILVPYTPGEENSEVQLQAILPIEKELPVKVVPIPLKTAADVTQWTSRLASGEDLIFVTGSNVVLKNISAILEASLRAKIPTVSHLDDLFEKGVLFELTVDATEVGKMSGKALAKVLRGVQPSDIPIEFPRPKLSINAKTVATGHFSIPPAIMAWARGA